MVSSAALLAGCTAPAGLEPGSGVTTTTAPTAPTSTTTTSTSTPAAPTSTTVSVPTSGDDALQRRSLADLEVFVGWLGNQRGYVGEVGWPSTDSRWNALANRWYDRADRAGLWVTAWATGEWWGSYDLAVYGTTRTALDRRFPSADVLEAHPGSNGKDRGISVNGGEFGIGGNLGTGTGGSFSNLRPGTYDRDFHYDSQASFNYLASRGVEVVRLPFRWERLQPIPGGALDPAELLRIQDAIGRARLAGMAVIPVAMNYGAYWAQDASSTVGVRTPIGAANLPGSQLADLWSRLSSALAAQSNVLAWGIMNEPTEIVGGAAAWERVAQLVVDAVRATGDRRAVAVPTYNWSTASRVATTHPGGPWIRDPANNIVYEAHQYFDRNRAGEYRSYDAELADAVAGN